MKEIEERINELEDYIQEYVTSYDTESEWLKGYDQRIREELKWLKELMIDHYNDDEVDEALQNLIVAIIKLQNITDKNFVIIQLQDLLEEMTRSEHESKDD